MTLILPLSLVQGLRPTVLKCPAAGLLDTVTVTVSQPKSALALALGGSTRGRFAQGRKQAGHEAPHRGVTVISRHPLGVQPAVTPIHYDAQRK